MSSVANVSRSATRWLRQIVAFVIGLLRGALPRHTRDRLLRRRRERRFRDECAPALDLSELTDLVVRCPARNAYELDALLDRYAELALARHRCAQLLARDSRDDLDSRLARARRDHRRSVAVIERRIAHIADLGRLGRRLDESLGEVGDLVRYYAEVFNV
jgi:hypothetical protein